MSLYSSMTYPTRVPLSIQGVEMLPNRELLSGPWVKGSSKELRGNTTGHSTLLGNAVSPGNHCGTEVQTTRIQTKPKNCRDSPLGPSTAGLHTACVLWHSWLQPLLVKAHSTGVPTRDKAALTLRATTGPRLLCFPSALVEPWSSHQGPGWQQ